MNDKSALSLPELHSYVANFCSQNNVSLSGKTIILLDGEPGAGKTEFVRALVGVLCEDQEVAGEVASPTFALHHSYRISEKLFDHWDLYRLESEDDLESTGFWDQFSEPEYFVAIEWPQRLPVQWLPRDCQLYKVRIEKVDQKLRRVLVF